MRVPCTSDPSGEHDSCAALLARADGNRAVAAHANAVVAVAHLRRAAELRLEAWVLAVRSAPLDVDEFLTAVAA
jgi:hypothetical protein